MHIFFSLLICFAVSAFLVWRLNNLSGFGDSDLESLSLYEDKETYYLSYMNLTKFSLIYFQCRFLHGGGPTWEALLAAAMQIEDPDLESKIHLDSEGEAVYFETDDYGAAVKVKELLNRLRKDFIFRERCLLRAQFGGYLE